MRRFIFAFAFFYILFKVTGVGAVTFTEYFHTNKSDYIIQNRGSDIELDKTSYDFIARVVGYDWQKDHDKNSNSLTVVHKRISDPIMYLNSGIWNAVITKNESSIKNGKKLLVDIAKANTLYDTISPDKAWGMGKCYVNGVKSACHIHVSQEAKIFAAHYLISAVNIKKYLNANEKIIIDSYINNMYSKFIEPFAKQNVSKGIYQMANGGIGKLAYAHWTGNKELAKEEFKKRWFQFDKLTLKDGYYNNNSFRGVRALWYHSMALNNVLGYIAIAKAWKVEIPKIVLDKAKLSANVNNLGIDNYKGFKSRSKPFNISNKNSSFKAKHSRKHSHQHAIGLDVLMKNIGIEMSFDPIWNRKKGYLHIDRMLGFHPKTL